MSNGLTIRVVNLNRFNGKGGAVAFFDVVLNDTVVLKGNTLKKTAQGTWRWQPPAKKRLKKNPDTGQLDAVKDEKGFDIWDDHFKLFVDATTSKPSTAARDFESEVLQQAIEKYEVVGGREAGRGPRPAAATTARKAAPKAAMDDSEEDDLPY